MSVLLLNPETGEHIDADEERLRDLRIPEGFETWSDVRRKLESRWISVEDEMPSSLQRILFFERVLGDDWRVGYWSEGEALWVTVEWAEYERESVTHWMPLPEPPK